MGQLQVTLEVDMPDNQLAIALAKKPEGNNFIDTNRIFSTVFPGIHTPGQLRGLITSKTDKKTIVEYNEGYWELLEIKINLTDTLYLLKNVAIEMLILKQLKKQLTQLTGAHNMYSQILDKELPVGVLIIDKEYNVSFANNTLKRFFHIPSLVNLQKCYNYVKELKPCSDCILAALQTGGSKKKTFTADENRLITAEAHPVEDKFIIIFRDTTREINLIKEVKTRQEELESANRRIAERNDILKGLSTINIRIGQMRDLEAVLEIVIDAITRTFSCKKGAILLFNEAGKIKNAHFSADIHEAERNVIIKKIDIDTFKSKENPLAAADKKNGKSNGKVELEVAQKLKHYTIQDMVDKEKLIGRVFLYRPEKKIDQSILELFLAQVIVYLDNLELHRRLEETAQTDSLTGVFNRYYFNRQFKEEKELSLRFGQPLSLILIDLNGLKEINDRVGHEAGDRMLEQTARILSGNTSSLDSIYRIGGDEFVILLSNCPENQLDILVNMFKEIQAAASFEYNGKTYPLRFCLGGACSTAVRHDRLKAAADKRMYLDKENFYKTHKKYR